MWGEDNGGNRKYTKDKKKVTTKTERQKHNSSFLTRDLTVYADGSNFVGWVRFVNPFPSINIHPCYNYHNYQMDT